ncbi:MAG: BolA family protein [Pseudomonadota bacterium]
MLTSAQRIQLIRDTLHKALAPSSLEIIDDSDKHAGHRSAGGRGHFQVNIVSAAFRGKRLLERHRMVYNALGEAMETEIHALSIQAKTPEEINP